MGRVLPFLVVLGLTIYCAVEVAQADPRSVRVMPRWMWALIVICLPIIGPICWLAFGRPRGGPRNVPPDDDPEFLRTLR